MVVRVVRPGTERALGEGIRIGTVRRPPGGVPESGLAARNWYDAWFPNLAPGAATVKQGQGAQSQAQWAAFEKQYRVEMARPDARHAIELRATLSHHTNFSVGCHCEDEEHCHRSVVRALLQEHGAKF